MSFELQPVIDVRSKRVTAYEVLYRGFKRDNEKAFEVVDEEWDLEILSENLSGLLALFLEGKLPSPHRFFVNLKPSTLILHTSSVIRLIEKLPFMCVLELREDYIREKEFERIKGIRDENGILLSVDDFGKGASNLDRIIHLRPEFVKIDLKLVKDIPVSFLVHTALALKDLKVKLIAEKVETHEDLKRSAVMGVDMVQGYLFGGKK